MLSASVLVAASAYSFTISFNMRSLALDGMFGIEVVTVHRDPSAVLQVKMRAGKPSGSRISSERRVPHESEKHDITEPKLRTEHAGCPTLLTHVASNSDWSSGSMVSGSTKSPDTILWNAMLISVAPAPNALRTAR